MLNLESLTAAMRAFQESRAILTGIELDVFTALGDGKTAGQTAAQVGADARATEMLLNALTACGLLAKQDGIFRNTAVTSRHLTGPARMAWMHHVHLWDRWSTLTDSVRKGTAAFDGRLETRSDNWTEAFIAAMHRNATERAPQVVKAVGIEGVQRFLDVGGGSGAYSIAFAQAAAKIYVDLLDLEPVTRIAQRHIAEAGLADRIQTRVGDLRHGSLGENYDVVFLSAICHMLSEEENLDLIQRCREACALGGRVVVQDFILGPDKTAPQFGALFALNMLVGTTHGSAYSETEYDDWMRAAGLAGVRHVALPGPAGLMIGMAG